MLAIPKEKQITTTSTTSTTTTTTSTRNPETEPAKNRTTPTKSTNIGVLGWKLFGVILLCLIFVLGVAWWRIKAQKVSLAIFLQKNQFFKPNRIFFNKKINNFRKKNSEIRIMSPIHLYPNSFDFKNFMK